MGEVGHSVKSVKLPCAEVEEIWPRDGRIALRLRLVGAAAEGATLLLRTRAQPPEPGRELRFTVEGGGREFAASVPLEPLVSPGGSRGEAPSWVWDLYLVPADVASPLRLGRHLDDVQGKKHIFRYPVQHVGRTAVEPYYTVKDNLSIDCRRTGAKGAKGAKSP